MTTNAQLNTLLDRILSLIAMYPVPAEKAIRRMLGKRERLGQVALLFQHIGYAYARELFPQITEQDFQVLQVMTDHLTGERMRLGLPEMTFKAFQAIHDSLVNECMDYDEDEESGRVYARLMALSSVDLGMILNSESTSDLAFLAGAWNEEQVVCLLKKVGPRRRGELVLQINRLSQLPEDVIAKRAREMVRRIASRIPKNAGLEEDMQVKALRDYIQRESPEIYDAVFSPRAWKE